MLELISTLTCLIGSFLVAFKSYPLPAIGYFLLILVNLASIWLFYKVKYYVMSGSQLVFMAANLIGLINNL